jgi:hypothetical protein
LGFAIPLIIVGMVIPAIADIGHNLQYVYRTRPLNLCPF